MAMVSVIVVVAAALSGASATNEAMSMTVSTSASLAGMRRYFVRSDDEHSKAMDSISQRMNASSALHVLERHEQATPVLMQLARRVLKTHTGSQEKTFLQATKAMGSGYGGFKPALDLLNSMLYESMNKYDTEAAKCTDYYSRQCGLLESIRGEISASNYKSATCREKTLGAQAQIEMLQDNGPEMGQQLKQTDLKCKHEVHELDKRLKIVLGDIGVLTQILEMTDCKEEKSMLQTQLLHCQSNCKQKKFITLDHQDLQKHLSSLKSPVALGLVQEGFSQLAADSSNDAESEEAESESDDSEMGAPVNKMNKTAAPVPRTQVPDSPCDDPYQGAPSSDDKRAAKCTVSGTPQCGKIQERFLLIQSSIMDERDDLKEEISHFESKCEETKGNLEEQLKDADQDLKDEQTKLADSMTCEANAGEQGRLSNKEHTDSTADLKSMMKACSGNYQNFETEICGLKKIRGELYKMRGTAKVGLFQDCQVSAWEAQECSVPCGGGVQKLTRSVATQPAGGAKCLPLAQMKSCQDQPCPVDCRLDTWNGWSKCSAECGGGVQQRLRDVKRHMKNNGKPCGETSETKACSVQSCESDCELSDWGGWGKCSKECDSGTRKRQKYIKKAATGQGSCAGMWDGGRLEYAACNKHRCQLEVKAETLKCKAELDVVLLIDGSGSLGKKGWEASLKAAEAFVGAFEGEGTEARVSVILFSGPKSWAGVRQCFSSGTKPVDIEKTCGITMVKHFTKDLKRVKKAIASLEWPKGSTLTSLALSAAAAELNLGRKNARSVVAVITDGRPMSFRKTKVAARNIRKAARLLWVPVTRFAPLKSIRSWATRRWQENVIPVKSFTDLAKPDVVNKMIADICPPKR